MLGTPYQCNIISESNLSWIAINNNCEPGLITQMVSPQLLLLISIIFKNIEPKYNEFAVFGHQRTDNYSLFLSAIEKPNC